MQLKELKHRVAIAALALMALGIAGCDGDCDKPVEKVCDEKPIEHGELRLPPPEMGSFDYGVSVNMKGEPTIFTEKGEAWKSCDKPDCGLDELAKVQRRLSEVLMGSIEELEENGIVLSDSGDPAGFVAIRFDVKKGEGEMGESKGGVGINVSLFNEAYADVREDGICTIVGYFNFGGTWFAKYHPLDKDCPPF